MKEKIKNVKAWLFKFNKKNITDWLVTFNQSQLNWIRLGVIGIWIIALFNIIQFFSTEESGTIPVYVKGGSIDVDDVYGTVNVQGSVDVDNTVRVTEEV